MQGPVPKLPGQRGTSGQNTGSSFGARRDERGQLGFLEFGYVAWRQNLRIQIRHALWRDFEEGLWGSGQCWKLLLFPRPSAGLPLDNDVLGEEAVAVYQMGLNAALATSRS